MKTNIKPGDVILQDYKHPNKFLNWFLTAQDYFDDGPYNHAMIYYGETDLGKHTILESSFEGLSFRYIDINDPQYKILNLKRSFNKEQIQGIINDFYVDAPKKYDSIGLVGAAISTIIWKLTGEKISVFSDNPQYFCSELVAEIYKKANRPFNIKSSLITPNDIFRSNKFK